MSLESEVRAAMAAAIRDAGAVTGNANAVFATAPEDAVAPFVAIGDMLGFDWSTKDLRGRELRVAILAVDREPDPMRVADLADAAVAALATMPKRLGPWQLGAIVHLRSLTRRRRGGGWAVEADVRVRAITTP